jgi:hypothetical protein
MKISIRTGFGLLVLLSVPAVGAAQVAGSAEAGASAAAEAAARAGSGEVAGSGAAAIDATMAAGLPPEPVARVIAEGRAKGMSAARIDRAAMEMQIRMEAARAALERENRRASDAEIVAGAEALAAGASTVDLRAVGDAAPNERSLEVSLATLAEMRAGGTDGAEAAARIAARLRAGAADQAIASLATGADAAAGAIRAGSGGRGTIEAGAGARGGLDVAAPAGRIGVGIGGGAGVRLPF